jgi:hypothetical protein
MRYSFIMAFHTFEMEDFKLSALEWEVLHSLDSTTPQTE